MKHAGVFGIFLHASLVFLQPIRVDDVSWQMVFLIIIFIIGILVGPYELLLVLQRMWKQRQQDRIAGGEDVRPRKLPWDDDEDD